MKSCEECGQDVLNANDKYCQTCIETSEWLKGFTDEEVDEMEQVVRDGLGIKKPVSRRATNVQKD